MSLSTRASELIEPLDETPPLRHRIHGQLERLISTGSLAPGTRLVETELAATLGVSRGPIREALQLLQRDGFVDLRPRQGAFVHLPTMKEINDFYDIRRALETESARLAAQRVTPAGAKRLKEVLDLGLKRLEAGDDPSTAPELSLHQEVTVIADNPVLAQMLDGLELRTRWYRSPFEPSLRKKAWEEHRLIVEAICAGDVDGAVNAMTTHVDHAREHLAAARAESFEEG